MIDLAVDRPREAAKGWKVTTMSASREPKRAGLGRATAANPKQEATTHERAGTHCR